MSERAHPRVFSIPPGAAFLPTLADALLSGRLLQDFRLDGDPLKLAGATIYVPTRRAARELRAAFVERSAGGSAILPTVKPLGEFDEDEAAFEEGAAALDLAPPISAIDRLLHLAPLVRVWKKRLPAHVALADSVHICLFLFLLLVLFLGSCRDCSEACVVLFLKETLLLPLDVETDLGSISVDDCSGV
jgi:inactivated superfamily I helicase